MNTLQLMERYRKKVWYKWVHKRMIKRFIIFTIVKSEKSHYKGKVHYSTLCSLQSTLSLAVGKKKSHVFQNNFSKIWLTTASSPWLTGVAKSISKSRTMVLNHTPSVKKVIAGVLHFSAFILFYLYNKTIKIFRPKILSKLLFMVKIFSFSGVKLKKS